MGSERKRTESNMQPPESSTVNHGIGSLFHSQADWFESVAKEMLPRVSIIITHYNYSNYLKRAISSAIAQIYPNVSVVVVDDASKLEERQKAETICEEMNSRVKFVGHSRNQGQVAAFYTGVDQGVAEFCCLLDPDDCYEPGYVSRLVQCHLRSEIYVAMVCSDQMYAIDGKIVTGGILPHDRLASSGRLHMDEARPSLLRFFGTFDKRWPWSSTSSMMFRRDALELMRPFRQFKTRIDADAYLATGARWMGGTLVLNESLVRREIHSENNFHTDVVISFRQNHEKATVRTSFPNAAREVFASILKNGGVQRLGAKHLRRVAMREFSARQMSEYRAEWPEVRHLLRWSDVMKARLRVRGRRNVII
ncbi:MAG: glycosyltransferase family 2 protein [Pseudomonadota bacterium]